RWLPPRIETHDGSAPLNARTVARRGRDLIVALAAGAGMSVLAYAVLTRPTVQGISDFFLLNALPEGHGSNVVNVILVDFRGFDTLGEITVLGIVALTVFALLRRFRPSPESIKEGPLRRQQGANNPSLDHVDRQADPDSDLTHGNTQAPAVLARLLLPIAVLVPLLFLLRGHDLLGGGLVGGLILATAIILQYIV